MDRTKRAPQGQNVGGQEPKTDVKADGIGGCKPTTDTETCSAWDRLHLGP